MGAYQVDYLPTNSTTPLSIHPPHGYYQLENLPTNLCKPKSMHRAAGERPKRIYVHLSGWIVRSLSNDMRIMADGDVHLLPKVRRGCDGDGDGHDSVVAGVYCFING